MGLIWRALRRWAVAAAVLAASWSLAAAAYAAPALWVMHKGETTIYLFGTMHVLKPEEKWHTPLFDQAYARASTLWFETDMDVAPATMQGLILKYGIDPQRTLSQKLTPETAARVKAALVGTGVDYVNVEHMRPWAVGLMLTVLPMVQAGYRPEAGADAALTTAAKNGAKQVRTFETVEEQIHIFADLSEQGEIQFLEDVLDDNAGDGGPNSGGDQMATSWSDGDLVASGSLLVNDMRVDRPELYEAIIKRRNLAWAIVLDQQMHRKGVFLVNVGALHLIGPDGIPQLMRARGYKVERIQ